MTPTCPPAYSCTFVPKRPPTYDVWWEGPWGIVVAVLIVIAVAATIVTLGYYVWQRRSERERVRAAADERRDQQAHEFAMEEQKTMQADSAHGDVELYRLITGRTLKDASPPPERKPYRR